MDLITYLSQNASVYFDLTITIILGMLIRDFASNFIAGCAFYFSKDFKEGDHIIIDDEEGIVVKIGIRKTIFGIVSGQGYVWRYVPNTRIQYTKLEKIIRRKDEAE